MGKSFIPFFLLVFSLVTLSSCSSSDSLSNNPAVQGISIFVRNGRYYLLTHFEDSPGDANTGNLSAFTVEGLE